MSREEDIHGEDKSLCLLKCSVENTWNNFCPFSQVHYVDNIHLACILSSFLSSCLP